MLTFADLGVVCARRDDSTLHTFQAAGISRALLLLLLDVPHVTAKRNEK